MEITYQDINRILKKEDIEGFIESGAPDDEYLSEAKKIMLEIDDSSENKLDTDELISIITIVWKQSFELSNDDIKLRKSAIKRVAIKILES